MARCSGTSICHHDLKCHMTSIFVLLLRGATLLPPDTVQMRRDRFRQQKQQEKAIETLQKTTVFVGNYLRTGSSVWSFDNKDQNLLTSEVGSCDCHMHWQEACDLHSHG